MSYYDLTLPERLDRASASILASASERIAKSPAHATTRQPVEQPIEPPVQRLSFARTRRLDASGLEALRLFCKQARAQGNRVSLELLSSEIYALLSLCGFRSICELSLMPEDSGSILP